MEELENEVTDLIPENEETTAAPVDEETTDNPPTDIERLLVEAEERGYLRGLNEQAARLLDRPAMGQNAETAPTTHPDDGEVMILNRSRRSVWNL